MKYDECICHLSNEELNSKWTKSKEEEGVRGGECGERAKVVGCCVDVRLYKDVQVDSRWPRVFN